MRFGALLQYDCSLKEAEDGLRGLGALLTSLWGPASRTAVAPSAEFEEKSKEEKKKPQRVKTPKRELRRCSWIHVGPSHGNVVNQDNKKGTDGC